MTDDKNKDSRLIDEMFTAVRGDNWDARPGFEGRLMHRIKSEKGYTVMDLTSLIWKAVPIAGVLSLAAVVLPLVTGSASNIDTALFSGIFDPIRIENWVSLGVI